MKKINLSKMEAIQGGLLVCNEMVLINTGMCISGSGMCEHRPLVMCIM